MNGQTCLNQSIVRTLIPPTLDLTFLKFTCLCSGSNKCIEKESEHYKLSLEILYNFAMVDLVYKTLYLSQGSDKI